MVRRTCVAQLRFFWLPEVLRGHMKVNATILYFLVVMALAGFLTPPARSQKMSSFDRDRALQMLDQVAKDIRKHYYDPKFHGVDWDAKVAEEKNKIKNETSLNMALAHIAAALISLDDSHTFFLPPPRPYRHDYGFQMTMIDNRCYVSQVRPDSDAEAQGVKRGDEVMAIEGYAPDRQTLWKLNYRFRLLRPQPDLQIALRDPSGRERQVVDKAKIVNLKRVADWTTAGGASDLWDVLRESEDEQHRMRIRSSPLGDELLVAKLPAFFFDQQEVDGLIDKARKHQALILDLRGNPGGAIETLKYLVGGVFENDVKIGNRAGRKELKPEIAKSRGRSIFTGKMIVLVDSESASASELFARIVQLEKRGLVIGDRSAGSVMEAKRYSYETGAETVVFYGASITESDLIMTDGKSLEHIGVTPDELVLPSAADLASGRDPVLAYAAGQVGVKLTPEDAGKMFPYEWARK
jgi:carboxyl-terminal processing protease